MGRRKRPPLTEAQWREDKSKPNTFDNSWEVLSVANGVVTLGGPGSHEVCRIIQLSEQWDYVALLTTSPGSGSLASS